MLRTESRPVVWAFGIALGLMAVPPRAVGEADAGGGGAIELEEARTLLEEQRYHKAAVAAFDVLSRPCSSPVGAEARWILGSSLDIIGLPQLAATWYRDVVRYGSTGGPFAGDALQAWAAAVVRLDDTSELIQRLEALPFDPGFSSPRSEAYQYLKAVALWQSDDPDGARMLLDAVVNLDTLVGWQATYLLALLDVSVHNRDAAYNRLVPLSRGHPDMPEDGSPHLEILASRLHDLALAGIARIQFAAGEYEDARTLYERLGPDSEQWPRTSYELAWTDFHLGRLDEAVKALAPLRLDRLDPEERAAFVPEAELLAALIYIWTGQYDLADGVLREYLDQVHELRAALRDVQEAYHGIEDAPAVMAALYGLVPLLPPEDAAPGETPETGFAAGSPTDPRAEMARTRLPVLRPILEDIRRDRNVAGAMHRVYNCRADYETLSRQMSWWQETDLCAHLRALLVQEEQRALFEAGRGVQAELERYRMWLGELDVLALAYRREVTLQRLREATGEEGFPRYEGEPLPPFDFVHP